MAFSLPASLDARLVADAVFSRAYDALVPEERAVIKTAIARMAAVCGAEDVVAGQCAVSMRQGFRLHRSFRPASWAVVLWDGAYAGPGRVLAALLPAILAGVSPVVACRVRGDASPFPEALLAALELAGQELVADAGPEEAVAFVEACCKADPRGRLVLLGRDPAFGDICRFAAEYGTPALWYAAPVRIGIAAASFATPLSHDHLRFAQPDAEVIPFEGDVSQGNCTAVFCAEEAVPAYCDAVPLVLSPGNEAYWAWPGLGRGFFRESGQGIV